MDRSMKLLPTLPLVLSLLTISGCGIKDKIAGALGNGKSSAQAAASSSPFSSPANATDTNPAPGSNGTDKDVGPAVDANKDDLPDADQSAAPSGTNPQDRSKKAVVLVAGWLMPGATMTGTQLYLTAQGIPNVHIVNIPGGGGGMTMQKCAELVSRDIEDLRRQGIERFDLIGQSMGGLVCREYVRTKGANGPPVDNVITLASPNLGNGPIGGSFVDQFITSVETQMAKNSTFISTLNSTPLPQGTKGWGIWTPDDLIVRPASNGRYPGVPNYRIEGLGASAHAAVSYDPRSLEVVHQILIGTPPPTNDMG